MTEEDKIEVVGQYKHVHVRKVRRILDDGVKIAETFSRRVIEPTDDVSLESAEVKAICSAVHTDAIKEAYAAYLNAKLVHVTQEEPMP